MIERRTNAVVDHAPCDTTKGIRERIRQCILQRSRIPHKNSKSIMLKQSTIPCLTSCKVSILAAFSPTLPADSTSLPGSSLFGCAGGEFGMIGHVLIHMTMSYADAAKRMLQFNFKK
jgi:hypothetical protein